MCFCLFVLILLKEILEESMVNLKFWYTTKICIYAWTIFFKKKNPFSPLSMRFINNYLHHVMNSFIFCLQNGGKDLLTLTHDIMFLFPRNCSRCPIRQIKFLDLTFSVSANTVWPQMSTTSSNLWLSCGINLNQTFWKTGE